MNALVLPILCLIAALLAAYIGYKVKEDGGATTWSGYVKYWVFSGVLLGLGSAAWAWPTLATAIAIVVFALGAVYFGWQAYKTKEAYGESTTADITRWVYWRWWVICVIFVVLAVGTALG